jgi:hypothetical protein
MALPPSHSVLRDTLYRVPIYTKPVSFVNYPDENDGNLYVNVKVEVS